MTANAKNDAGGIDPASAAGETEGRGPSGRVVFVTGRAGAGRTTAINALEDLGFETVDTPPLRFAAEIARRAGEDAAAKIAIGIDARTAGFSPDAVAEMMSALRAEAALAVELLFLDGDDETLRRRYTETRRRHPLSGQGGVEDGLARDRALMLPVRPLADWVLDTSDMSRADLAEAVRARYGVDGAGLTLTVASFSYRDGLPADADVVFDCRFLRNPYYDPALRPLDGRDPRVAAHVAADPRFDAFAAHLEIYPDTLLAAYAAEGKSYLTVAFGCTGGQHRSVAVAERFAARARAAGWGARVRHRAIEARAAAARQAADAPATRSLRRGVEAAAARLGVGAETGRAPRQRPAGAHASGGPVGPVTAADEPAARQGRGDTA